MHREGGARTGSGQFTDLLPSASTKQKTNQPSLISLFFTPGVFALNVQVNKPLTSLYFHLQQAGKASGSCPRLKCSLQIVPHSIYKAFIRIQVDKAESTDSMREYRDVVFESVCVVATVTALITGPSWP